jgi:L-asparagine oxygenase
MGMLRIDLSDVVTSRLSDHLSRLPAPLPDVDAVLAQLLQTSALLPVEAVQTILSFRADPRAPSALLVTGIPIDSDLPPTPLESTSPPHKASTISECALLLFAVLLGEPVSYLAEKGGVLVQDVFPTRAERNKPCNESSTAPLGFHTELVFSHAAPDQPFHVSAPDFVLLLGLRCATSRAAATLFVEARDVCGQLSDRHLECLRESNYQLIAPYSFTRVGDGSRPLSQAVPLLRGPVDAPSLAFDSACGVQAISESAEEAFGALVAACENRAFLQTVQLGPGDLLMLNNNRCAHARTAFAASFDGKDRWLQRAYVRHRIWPLPAASSNAFRVLA